MFAARWLIEAPWVAGLAVTNEPGCHGKLPIKAEESTGRQVFFRVLNRP